MIQLQRLEGFFRVVAAGGYTRAAKEFSYPITQPGVHQQVRKLEQEVGVRLLVRLGRDQMRPTAAGQRLFEYCRPFFEGLPSVIDELATGRFGGTLRIDAAALEIRHVLPDWIRALRGKWPELKVLLEELPSGNLERLASNRSDLLIEYFEDVPNGFESKRIGTYFVFLVAPSGHVACKRKRVRLATLAGEPFIAFHASLPYTRRQLAAVAALCPRHVLHASSTDAILGFVAAGLGYSLIPWPTADGPVVAGVRAERMHGAGTQFPILAVWKRGAVAETLIQRALSALPPRKGG